MTKKEIEQYLREEGWKKRNHKWHGPEHMPQILQRGISLREAASVYCLESSENLNESCNSTN